ncbi:aspartate ammonia-lyase [Kribbella turkmenica]|uniref:Aspartate ammonia-lyase n=1 Tax=Kribbella turkmenica TaxID=2530375 RepID=A0A4R4X8L2_9ACTN|nr:lyase family protein [Kribbella turkmenica]TDD26816.1 aspartate ammonia-lyase [Kribbella turkmenica]
MLFGTQTRLSLENFDDGRRRLGDVPAFVRSYALVKKAAAITNQTLDVVDEPRCAAIATACDEIVAGLHSDQFPTALLVGGGGTTANMNLNEVIAARATELAGLRVHPNDHVNASQSSNDTYPMAMAMTILTLAIRPSEALHELADALMSKAAEYAGTPYLGRTCVQDAVRLTADKTLAAQSRAILRGAAELTTAIDALRAVPLGATVLGTGVGAPAGFAERAVATVSTLARQDLTPTPDPYDALAHLDPYAAVADASARVSMTIARIAADLRLRSSGPRGGFAEITLPELQAGSSIMPAKVNPIVPEYAMQLSYRIRGAAHTVGYAVAAGELELNVMEPVIFDAMLDIVDDLDRSATAMTEQCIIRLRWDGPRRAENLAHALDERVEQALHNGYTATLED